MEEDDGWTTACSNQDRNLLKKLNEMRLNAENCDLKIVCGRRTFYAHKIILCATSSYFEKMLQNVFKESLENEVDLSALDGNALEIILNFMYSPKNAMSNPLLDKDFSSLINIFKATHYLDVKLLFDFCCKFLQQKISEDNYLVLWDLDKTYALSIFSVPVISFIINNLEAIIKKDEFLCFSADQVKEILVYMKDLRKDSPVYLAQRLLEWVKFDENEREQYIEQCFSLLTVNTFSKAFARYLITSEAILRNHSSCLKQLLDVCMKETTQVVPSQTYIPSQTSISNLREIVKGRKSVVLV